jgi:hypothetical protein
MKEREEKRGGAGLGCFILGVVAFLVPTFYVIGIGPAAWCVTNFPQTSQLLKTMYLPLAYLAKFQPIGSALEWYLAFWI